MSTDAGTLEQIEIDVNLDSAVPCQYDGGCGVDATWVGIARPCGHQVTMCDKHYAEAQNKLLDMLMGEYGLYCNLPSKTPDDDHIVEDLEWRPL